MRSREMFIGTGTIRVDGNRIFCEQIGKEKKVVICGGCVESDVITHARGRIRKNQTEPEIYTVDMTGIDAEEDGMVCGGIVDILFETV